MILTDNCDKAFFKWLFMFQETIFRGRFLGDEQDVIDEYDLLPSGCKYALMIDFFDSVGINILVDFWQNDKAWFSNIYYNETMSLSINTKQETRKQATKQAIIKANDIFNQKS